MFETFIMLAEVRGLRAAVTTVKGNSVGSRLKNVTLELTS